MRPLAIIILLGTAITACGQWVQPGSNRFLTYEQNESWLATTKSFDKSRQWTVIKQRFFSKENCNTSVDSIQYSPLIVINGVPLNISSDLTHDNGEKILSLLNEDTIEEINIIDTLSEQWTFCKPFSGVIILAVDKKTANKVFRLRLE